MKLVSKPSRYTKPDEPFMPFLPYSVWDSLVEKGTVSLSVTVFSIMAMAAVNVFLKNSLFADIIYASFEIWFLLFFAYVIFRLIYVRKRVEQSIQAKLGDTRLRTGFVAWKTVGDETRFFERVTWKEEFKTMPAEVFFVENRWEPVVWIN